MDDLISRQAADNYAESCSDKQNNWMETFREINIGGFICKYNVLEILNKKIRHYERSYDYFKDSSSKELADVLKEIWDEIFDSIPVLGVDADNVKKILSDIMETLAEKCDDDSEILNDVDRMIEEYYSMYGLRQQEIAKLKTQLPQEYTTKDATSYTISRQAAIKAIHKRLDGLDLLDWDNDTPKDYADETERIINSLPSAQPEQRWIPCRERMPECEQEVLICTMEKVYVSRKSGMEWYEEPIITPALYEDGTMLEVNSKWRWENIDYAGWDEEEDCGIIPEGWWENRHFNPDEVYNNVVDRRVVAWMPLPEPYKERRNDG